MSLSHSVRNARSPLRRFIDERFVFQPLSRTTNKVLKALPSARRPYEDTYSYALTGTAADLMIRALFDPAIHRTATVGDGLSMLASRSSIYADAGGEPYVSTWGDGKWFYDDTPGPEPRTAEVVRGFESFAADRDFRRLDDAGARRLAAFCLMFGRIDNARRSFRFDDLMRFGHLPLEEKLSAMSTPTMIDDLVDLFRSFEARHRDIVAGATRVVTGGLLAGSADAGGADFDFVVDGCLFEIKTTIKPNLSTDMLRQCVGYWLLDYDDEHEIREIALDLPRQGYTLRLNVRRDLLSPELSAISDGELRAEFRRLLRSTSADDASYPRL